VKVQFTVE